jgi:hypothetical protein
MPVKSITRLRLSARRVTDVGHSLAVCTCAQNIAGVLMLLDVSNTQRVTVEMLHKYGGHQSGLYYVHGAVALYYVHGAVALYAESCID